MARLIALFVAALLAPACAWSLEWESDRIVVEAGPLDESAEVVFKFANPGASAVSITDVHSSCGCTVPALARRTYEAGEKGELRAVFTFNGLVGRQTKHITIRTDEPGAPSYELTLEVDIPRLYELDRYFVVWRKDEPADAKSIRLEILRPDLIHSLSIESRSPAFSAQVKPQDKPGIYDLEIIPAATGQPIQASLVVKTDYPAENPRVITVYALVR